MSCPECEARERGIKSLRLELNAKRAEILRLAAQSEVSWCGLKLKDLRRLQMELNTAQGVARDLARIDNERAKEVMALRTQLAAERLKTAAAQSRVVELREVLKVVRVDLARWINKQLKKNNSPDRSLDQLGAIDDALARPDDLEALREFGRSVAMGVLCHPKRDTEPVVEAVVGAVLRGEGA